MLGLLNQILKAEDMAYAVVGQALLDEGSIRTDKVEIFYNDRNTASYLFEVAKSIGLADKLRIKRALHQTKFGFTIKYNKWVEVYRRIGPLPDKDRDHALRFLVRPHTNKPRYLAGRAKNFLLAQLRKRPRTAREIYYELGLSGSTIRKHLRDLQVAGKVTMIGKNKKARKGKRRSAFLWNVVPTQDSP